MMIQKASLYACLFLFASFFQPFGAHAQQWTFSGESWQAYQDALQLKTKNRNVQGSKPGDIYAQSLSEALELLLTEDQALFDQLEPVFEDRLRKPITREDYFLQSELRLQWTFIYLKFGHELDAASHFRDAFKLASTARKKFPDFIAIRKPLGLMQVMVGSVPEKYAWVMELFGMRGTIDEGLKNLEYVKLQSVDLKIETEILLALIEGYILQNPDGGLTRMRTLLESYSDHKLLMLAGSALAAKAGKSELSLPWLQQIYQWPPDFPIYYNHYLAGEVFLQKGDYAAAISEYRRFAENFKGRNNIKDAWYKMGVCYWLNGEADRAESMFKEALRKGREDTEADKSAARALEQKTFPNALLAKARYATDGGYYDRARMVLNNLSEADFVTKKDRVEYFYRKARLEHRTDHVEAARLFYQQVIDMASSEPWYFAANSSLQLGYLAVAAGNPDEAKTYFRQALSYPRHEYKNSIDTKAKTALNRISR